MLPGIAAFAGVDSSRIDEVVEANRASIDSASDSPPNRPGTTACGPLTRRPARAAAAAACADARRSPPE